MYTHKLYIIENKTPLHVGSGDSNFDLVDRQIQKDILTGYPTIHSSSLKGALREYINFRHTDKESKKNFLAYIFGDDDNSGKIRFTDAYLLTIPMRSEAHPYHHCTSPKAIEEFLELIETFSLNIAQKEALKKVANYKGNDIAVAKDAGMIEDFISKVSNEFDFDSLEKLLGAPLAIVPNEIFEEMLQDLPVIARNQLENGESKGLWYEEVLPRKSKLYTLISEPTYLNKKDANKLENAFNRFSEYLCDANTIHIGANASIGYGVTIFKELKS